MWVNKDIDIPETLLSAQREGRLVIFAGAGVSMGAPSNLPGFRDLALRIAGGLLAPLENEAFDVFLGRVASLGVDVQKLAREVLNVPGSAHRPLHRNIVELFRSRDDVRIVTTNFDPHFTNALHACYPGADIFTAPALPLGRDFFGAVYIHGSLARQEPLVLTDLEFGRAYLIDGYATRFLTEMFAEYVVLFVGYSHSDVVMQYMARAFIRAKERFAFSTTVEIAKWTQLGIRPIVYPERAGPERFGAIDDGLAAWVALTKMGVLDHEARIAKMVLGPPPLAPDDADYARAICKDFSTVQYFCRDCTSLEWFKWLEREGLLDALVTPHATLRPREQILTTWIARAFAVAHANEVMDFVQRHANRVHPGFASMLVFWLAHGLKGVPPAVLKPWVVTLMALDWREAPRSISDLLEPCCAHDETLDVGFALFQFLLRPQADLKPRRTWSLTDAPDTRVWVNAEIALFGEIHDLKEAWSKRLRAHLEIGYRGLLGAVTAFLEESFVVARAARATDGWDGLSLERSAIEPHSQDRFAKDWEFLIDVARDVLEWLLEHQPTIGAAAIALWQPSGSLILQRLAIHGWGKRLDVEPDAVLAHVEEHDWLYSRGLKHEVFTLLKAVFPRASAAAQERFIRVAALGRTRAEPAPADADSQSSDDYASFNAAAWLAQIAPESEVAQRHFAAEQHAHPEFGVRREWIDFDHYVGPAGWVARRSPVSDAEFVTKSADDAIEAVVRFQPDPQDFRGPSREGLLNALQQAATNNYEWSESVAAALIARQLWDANFWTALLAAWRPRQHEDAERSRLLAMLEAHEDILRVSPRAAGDLLDAIADVDGLALDVLDSIERIGERLLAYSTHLEVGVYHDGRTDWATSAINHPAGHVAFAWLKTLSTRTAANRPAGIPAPQRTRFEGLLADPGANGVLGRVVFAGHAQFLFALDPEWTTGHLLPLFDWSVDVTRAEQAWSGFLTWGEWSDVFFERVRPMTVQTFSHLDRLERHGNPLSERLGAAAVFSAHDPWTDQGWLFHFVRLADADNRQAWAHSVAQFMDSLPSRDAAVQLWRRWLRRYCEQRGVGMPIRFDDEESAAMQAWAVPLASILDEVVAVFQEVGAIPSTPGHHILYRFTESGLAVSHGAPFGRYLRVLLKHAKSLDHRCEDVYDLAIAALANGADRKDILSIAEDMARLGCPQATDIRDRARGA